jgi:hypothetical protein
MAPAGKPTALDINMRTSETAAQNKATSLALGPGVLFLGL